MFYLPIRNGQSFDQMRALVSPELPFGMGKEETDLSSLQKRLEIGQSILPEMLPAALRAEIQRYCLPTALKGSRLPKLSGITYVNPFKKDR